MMRLWTFFKAAAVLKAFPVSVTTYRFQEEPRDEWTQYMEKPEASISVDTIFFF